MVGPMAASKPIEPEAGSGLPRWQLALLVGTPIVLGVGAAYLWSRSRGQSRGQSRSKDQQSEGNEERKTPEGSEQDNMVTNACKSVGCQSVPSVLASCFQYYFQSCLKMLS